MYVAKKLKLAKNNGNKQINIINAVSIGAKEKILLVEVNNTTLLLGATPNHIETLHIFYELDQAKSDEKEENLTQRSFTNELSNMVN